MAVHNGFHAGSRTVGYQPTLTSSAAYPFFDADGWFTLADVDIMDRHPKFLIGFRMLCAPVAAATWTVACRDEKAKQFIDKTVRQFWQHDLTKAMSMLKFGSAGGEVVHRFDDDTNHWHFDTLKDIHLNDLRPLDLHGKLWGVRVYGVGRDGRTPGGEVNAHQKVDLRYPSSFWVANEPKYSNYYGVSRYAGAWKPWKEATGKHGAIDCRRMWYLKCSYNGGYMRYPEGDTQVASDVNGAAVFKSNQDIAREILEKSLTGNIMAMPSAYDKENGKFLWEYFEPKGNSEPRSLLDYPKQLDVEILEGLGIMPEVLQAAQSGSGWAGRNVPFLMFLTSEDRIVDTIMQAVVRQILRPLVAVNFGAIPFEVTPVSLVPKDEQGAQQAQPGPGQMMAGAPNAPGQGGAEGGGPGGGGGGEGPSPQDLLGGGGGGVQLSADPWEQYDGPHGGKGWRNNQTGEVFYQKEKPGQRGAAATIPASAITVVGKGKKPGRVGKILGGFKQALGKITDQPVLKQVKGALGFLKKQQGRFQGVLERRYGKKTAMAIMFSGMGVDVATTGVGALLGRVLYIPGLSILGSLPAVVLAESYRQGRRLAGATLALEGADLSPEEIERLGRKLHERLMAELEKYLKDHREEFEALKPDVRMSADVRALAAKVRARVQQTIERDATGNPVRIVSEFFRLGDDADPWVSYTGPRGGRGWKHSGTGRIVYGGTHPGQRRGRKETPAVPEKYRTDLTERHLGHLAGTTPFHEERIEGEVALIAQKMRIWEVHALAEKLGVSPEAKDSKTAMLAKIEAALRAKAHPEAPSQVAEVPTASLSVDPARFQYKINVAGKFGVGEEFKETKKFNPNLAGLISVWKDPADGKTYVINGHHRYELAHRTGYKKMVVRYIDAKDARAARAMGALQNIAGGKGTAVDAAKFMRDTGTTIEEMELEGISLRGPIARDAIILTRLSERAFERVAHGTLALDKALAVAKHVTDPEVQAYLFRRLDRREEDGKPVRPRIIEEMARAAALAPKMQRGGDVLFGDEEEPLVEERAEVAAHVRAELAKEVNDWLAVSSKRRASRVGEAGNVLDPEKNRELAKTAERVQNVYDGLVNRKGIVADAVNAASEKLVKATTPKARRAVKAEALKAVRGAVFKEAGVGEEEQKEVENPPKVDVKGAWEPADGYKVAVRGVGDRGDWDLEVKQTKGGKVGIGYPGRDDIVKEVPAAHFKEWVNDLSGKVEVPPDSEDADVNAVASGKAQFLGKGDDGLAFRVGNNVVKASTIVPFIPTNPGSLTPEQSVERLRQQTEVSEHLRAAGVPGLLPTKFVAHGGKGFQIKAHVEIPERFTPEQLGKVRRTMEAMHARGYVLGDDVQVGLLNGEPVMFDTGKAQKAPGDWAYESDSSFSRFAEKSGAGPQMLKQQAEKQLQRMKEFVEKPGKDRGFIEHHLAHYEPARAALVASDPEHAEAINARFNALKNKALAGVTEAAPGEPVAEGETRWHVTPHGEAIRKGGFAVKKGEGIGGPVSGEGVSVWKDEKTADKFHKEAQDLEDVRTSSNPEADAERLTGTKMSVSDGMARLFAQKLGRNLTSAERAVVHVQSVNSPYIPATSFFGTGPKRTWEKLAATVRPGVKSKIAADDEELYEPGDLSHKPSAKKEPFKAPNVGATVKWQSAVGEVDGEFRGLMDGPTGKEAVIITTDERGIRSQQSVPVGKLSNVAAKKAPPTKEQFGKWLRDQVPGMSEDDYQNYIDSYMPEEPGHAQELIDFAKAAKGQP